MPSAIDIDRRTYSWVVPMKLLCLGLPRTGTLCAAPFAPELVRAYAEPKGVLNTRDIDSWYISVMSTIEKYVHVQCHRVTIPVPGTAKSINGSDDLESMVSSVRQRFPETWQRLFQKHYDLVRGLVPAENLLEAMSRRAGNLCAKFLEFLVPTKPFPRVNNMEFFQNILESIKQKGVIESCRISENLA
ncbi:hypothetical protein AJ80_08832 [Polytolypa hystricis UAMH7299]|uniref:Uncharacterized protein n=1 Tax=Polytolypa hystricis (strain UAMH7299) TaxID=1447883 RepID=A0A2B7X142_POLH7|nr:hypothetical protein AJ80_08832 [Polytolypa hystricis UAMH7299]